MESITTDIHLTAKTVGELNGKLADLRHNINNYLSLISAAAEIIIRKPELAPRMTTNILDQPKRIVDELQRFTSEFEKTLNIVRPPID
jgi:hypothetical protein